VGSNPIPPLSYERKARANEVKQRYRLGLGRLGPVKELGIKFTGKEEEEYIKASFAHFTETEALKLTKRALSPLAAEIGQPRPVFP
jgi:hypothetical protein